MKKNGRKRVLVIDDEEPIRNYLRDILEKAGYSVMDCGDGDKGIEMYLDDDFDIVLTDIAMPKKDGVEVLIEMKKVSPSTRIIAMSGVVDCYKLLEVANIFKADATIKKPFEKEEVLSAIKKVLECQPSREASAGQVGRMES